MEPESATRNAGTDPSEWELADEELDRTVRGPGPATASHFCASSPVGPPCYTMSGCNSLRA